MDRAYQKQITEARMHLHRAYHTLNFRSGVLATGRARRQVKFTLRAVQRLEERLSKLRKVV